MTGVKRAKAHKVTATAAANTIKNGWTDVTKTNGRPQRDSIFSVDTLLTDRTMKGSFCDDLNSKHALLGWLRVVFGGQDTAKEASQVTPVTFCQLFRFASSHDRWLVWLGFVFALLVGAITPLSMYLNGRIADILINYATYQASENPSLFISDGFVYVFISGGIGFGLVAFSFAQYYFLRAASLEITNTLRVKFISSVLRQDAAFFDTRKFGALNAQLNSNIERVSDGIGDKIGVLLRGIASFVVAMAVAFVVNWRIALSMCAVGPVCALVMTSLSRVVSYAAQRSLHAIEAAGAVLQETLLNVRTVQACNGERTMAKKFARRLAAGRRNAVLQYVCNGAFDGLFFLALYIFNAIGAYYGSRRVLAGDATGGDVIIVTNLIIIGAYYLGAMSPYIASVFKARIAAASIYTQIDKIPERIDAYSTDGQPLMDTSSCEIVFRDVFFSYTLTDGKRREVLRGLSWKARPGESVALVGHSGCGKSTCISLLTRLYECDAGELMVNGIDVRQLNIRALRASIGLVSQEPALFGNTVFENIAFGDPNITPDRVETACRMANAHEFILKLEHGYDTRIGAGHVHLSGGQKQRLAIARALVRDPPILLLDEATSALDAESEILVQKALESASRGRTTVIIAHRLSTLRNVDKIVVIDQGRVVETGTHKELSAMSDGIYAKFVRSQSFNNSPLMNEMDKENESNNENNTEEDDYSNTVFTPIDHDSKSVVPLTKIPGNDTTMITKLAESSETKNKTKIAPFWNNSIFRLYYDATDNYGKLTAAVIISAMRGLELIFYVKLIGTMFTTFSDYQTKHDVDAFDSKQYVIVCGNIVLGIFCLITISFGHSLCGWTTENVVDVLKIRAFRNVLRQDGAFFDRPRCSSAELIRRITVDAFALKAPLDYRLFNLVNNGSAIVSLLISSFICSWRITLVGIVILSLLSILPTYFNLRMQRRVINNQCGDEVTKIAVEIIENVRTIQLLTKEDYFCEKYREKLMLLRRPAIITALFEAVIFALVQSFLFLSDAFCFGTAILVVYNQLNTPIDVYIASMNMGTASYAVLFVSTSLSYILRAKPPADSIFELIDARPSITEGLLKNVNKGQVELDSVDFAYPARPDHKVADALSLSVQRGECVALVGPSGGGKSTVISLLQRFYNPKAGSIKIDGINIGLYSLRALRQEVALVGQEPVLFSGSIYENIRLGVEHCTTLEDVVQACDMANAKTFIESFPSGYQTDVGEKSSKLSGGQKQRIAIARALVRKPKILLLDEATSALDAYSEQAVQQALSVAQCDRACIMIAHRLSSIQHADKIYFIRNGRVVESGTYRELMADSQSAFAQMVTKQRLH